MQANSFDRWRKVKLTVGVLAVGLIVSALVGIVLVLMGRAHPRF